MRAPRSNLPSRAPRHPKGRRTGRAGRDRRVTPSMHSYRLPSSGNAESSSGVQYVGQWRQECPRRTLGRERNAAHAGETIDTVRRQSELCDDVGSRKIGFVDHQRLQRSAERRQRLPDPPCVGGRRIDPHVEVDGCTRNAVHTQGMGADDQKPRVGLQQFDQNIAKILDHANLVANRLRMRHCAQAGEDDRHRRARVRRETSARARPQHFAEFRHQLEALGDSSRDPCVARFTTMQRYQSPGHLAAVFRHDCNLALSAATGSGLTSAWS